LEVDSGNVRILWYDSDGNVIVVHAHNITFIVINDDEPGEIPMKAGFLCRRIESGERFVS